MNAWFEREWAGIAQVFQIRRSVKEGEKEREEIVCGLTNLPRKKANARRLLTLNQEYWMIENGLHYRRDRTFDEDRSQLRMGHAPHLLALFNNTAISLMARRGQHNLPSFQRTFAYQFDRALALTVP